MTLCEWLDSLSDDTETTLQSIGTVDGVPNVALVRGRATRPVPNGFNDWTWCIPMMEETQDLLGGDNPFVFVWGPDWFEYADEYAPAAPA